ncbi:MAG: Altronate dehydratase, partial [Deltaproteobacteria bacterium]|nr:Altronate dehydratase [Deltaproteobacteria bacterium]
MEFQGYRRPGGKVGVRNHVLVIPSVVCSQGAAEMITRNIKGAVYLPNVFGCAQVGEDRAQTKRALVGFGLNPNVYSVLVVGNGCENLPAKEIAEALAPCGKRVEFIEIQEVGGTKKTAAKGKKIVREMLADAAKLQRQPIPVSELNFATECGGSDYTSGLGSNPALGACSDLIIEEGGTVILSETTELIGAEHLLARRARTPEIGKQVLDLIAWWEKEAIATGQDIRGANPAPGNIAGGITTIEEKSLGCIYKGGTKTLEEVIKYAYPPTKKGLILMDTPGHDIDQLTGMMAGGSQIAVFTTGRGTPTGSPIAPVIKITANAETYKKMKDNIDINVSAVVQGKETVKEAGKRIFDEVIA